MHNSMNTYVGVEVELHAVLITPQNGDEWSASRCCSLTTCSEGKKLMWQSSRPVWANRRISCIAWNSEWLRLSLEKCWQATTKIPTFRDVSRSSLARK